jgi:hypothetical protein
MKTVIANGHKIEIKGMGLTGVEKVFYDGYEVSSKFSMSGSTHVFTVTENGESIQYETRIGMQWHGLSWWCEVRRKGEIIYTDR